MKIAMQNDRIVCAEVGDYYEALRATGRFRWDRPSRTMRGDLCLITLEALASVCRLPPQIDAEYRRLRRIADAMEEQRRSQDPSLLTAVPVKNCKLMRHQIIGINMALILFGVVEV